MTDDTTIKDLKAQLAEQEREQFAADVKTFGDELQTLCKKCNLILTAVPIFIPGANGYTIHSEIRVDRPQKPQ
jgi:hypothetical protein